LPQKCVFDELIPIGADDLIPIRVDELIPMDVSDLFSRPQIFMATFEIIKIARL
jgi:hypothetical protein